MTRLVGMLGAALALLGLWLLPQQLPLEQPEQAAQIAFFSYSSRGSSSYEIYTYEAERTVDGSVQVRYDLHCGWEQYTLQAQEELLVQLEEIAERHGLIGWNGFSGSNPFMQDGYGFSLEIRLADGTEISAHGDNAFPGGYYEAKGEIDELFMGLLRQSGLAPEDIFY